MFSFTRFCLRVLADLNEIILRMKPKVILTIAITDRLSCCYIYVTTGLSFKTTSFRRLMMIYFNW